MDTNVFVAGLLTPQGVSARLVDGVVSGALTPLYDDRILGEYEEVLTRGRFQFPPQVVQDLMTYIEREGERITALPLPGPWPDPTDVMFAEVASTGKADALITGNKRHYPARLALHVRLLSPKEFLAFWGQT